MSNKIIRSICYFSKSPENKYIEILKRIAKKLEKQNYQIQTLRACTPTLDLFHLIEGLDPSILYSIGTITLESA